MVSVLVLFGAQSAAINAGNYPFGNVSAMIPGTQAIPSRSPAAAVESMNVTDFPEKEAIQMTPEKKGQAPADNRAQDRKEHRLAHTQQNPAANLVDANAPLPKLMELHVASVKAAQNAMDHYRSASLEIQAVHKEKVQALYNKTKASKHVENTQAKLKSAKVKRVEAASMDVGNVPRRAGNMPAKARLASAEAAVVEAEQAYLNAGSEEASADRELQAASAKAERAESTMARYEKLLTDASLKADTMAAAVKEALSNLEREQEDQIAMIAELKKRQDKVADSLKGAANHNGVSTPAQSATE